jgi:hypothetical protein
VTRRAFLVAAAAVIAAAVAAAIVVALVPGRSARVSPPRAGIGATATIVPQSVLFGDTVVGTVDVLVDTRTVDPASVQPQAVFSEFIPLRRPAKEVVETGPVTRIRYRYEFSCLTLAGLPPDPIRQGRELMRIRALRLTYRLVGGGTGAIGVAWPLMEHASRLTPIDQTRLTPIDQPPFHATLAPQPATYRISPTLLVWLLCAAGGLLVAIAGVLALRFGPRARVVAAEPLRPAAPVRQLTALERALLLLDRARERGGVADQRKALENLAGVLQREGERELAGSATALAWAEQPPPTDATGALAAAVQRRIDDGGNGHHGES